MKLEYFLKLYRNPGQLKSTKKIHKRRKQANEDEIDVLDYLSTESRLAIARSVAKVFSKLMVATAGFNYHDNILETGIPLLNDRDEVIRNEINSGTIELFKTDKLGEKTLKGPFSILYSDWLIYKCVENAQKWFKRLQNLSAIKTIKQNQSVLNYFFD